MPNRGIRAESMGDGAGWLVKGTTDVEGARQHLRDHHIFDDLEVSDARWFRIVPAYPHDPCDLGHTHHLVPDRDFKRGAFPAVVLTPAGQSLRPGVTRRPSRRPARRRWA